MNPDDAGIGSLRQAVADAGIGDQIVFDTSLAGQTINFVSGISITQDVEIQGLGADQLTLSGGTSSRMFVIGPAAQVLISGLTFIDGNEISGGAIAVAGAASELTIQECQFLNNSALANGGAIDNNGASIRVFDSTFSGNTTNTFGGAINNAGSGQLFIRNSTLSGNMSGGDGGAITNLDGMLDIANSTVINNFADNFAGGIGNNSPSTITNIRNTIVAGNTTSNTGFEFGNLAGASGIVSGGGNFIGVGEGPGNGDTLAVFVQPTDSIGSVVSPLDPELGVIADNGGPTLTHLPDDSSQVLDNGVAIDLPTLDQRGLTRLANSGVDIGAVEVQAALSEEFFIDGFEELVSR